MNISTAKPRKVLHIVDSLGLGGTQTILKRYFESRSGDLDIGLYSLRFVPHHIQIRHSNVEVNPSPNRFSIAPMVRLRSILRSQPSTQILHCHLFRAQFFGLLLKRLFFPDMTLVFHEHGRAVGQEGESAVEALLFRQFLRLAWRHVDRFICISEHTRARLLEVVPEAGPSVIVLSNPIPVSPATGQTVDRAALRRDQGIPDEAFVVGFASRLVERKGWKDFLDAIALLAPRLPVFFLLAGDGEERRKAEARIGELGLRQRGQLLGHIDWMTRFYQCLDCFVMPSHWEPHGLAHLEAQSFGVPVVVSSAPGLASTVEREVDALLFPPGDTDALADCIQRLACDSALRGRLIAGGLANSAGYGVETFAAKLEQVYSSATDYQTIFEK